MQAGVASLHALGAANANLKEDQTLQDLWPPERVQELSKHEAVDRVVCLGTVLAAELKVPEGSAGGYGSNVARSVTQSLRHKGVYARPLGNVVYLMVTPTTEPAVAADLLNRLFASL